MKIALFTDTYPPEINGVATSCKSLRDILIKHGHEVLVVTTNSQNKKFIAKDGYILIPGPVMRKIYGYRFAGFFNYRAERLVKKFSPDIIHIQTDWCVGLFGRHVAKKLVVPVVYTYHTNYEDYSYLVTAGHFDRIARGLLQQFSRLVITRSDEFITPSVKTKDYMRQIGIDVYANVIPTGIDFEKFDPKNIDQNVVKKLKNKYKIKKDDFVLMSIGRLGKEKSIDFCIEGFREFCERNPKIPAKMVIVGKGPYEEELKKQVDDVGLNDKVIFTGPCLPSDVQNYYALGQVFASASLTETQGLTYMEAMAAHLYVLARYDHNLLDVVSEGKTGFFFETPEEFAKKMLITYKMYKKNDRVMTDNALKAIEQYSIETFYNSIIEVYKRGIKKYW